MDDRILRFEAVVEALRGRHWAPESALPSPKGELFELLTAAKRPTRRGDGTYERLGSLIVDVVRFIPDSDLAAAAPYLNDRGGITGAPLGEGQSQERDRLVEVFQRHRADGERLLDRALIRGGGPIGESVWTLQTRRPDPRFGYFREGGGGYDGRR